MGRVSCVSDANCRRLRAGPSRAVLLQTSDLTGRGDKCGVVKITPNFSFACVMFAVKQISVCEQRNAAVVEMVLEGGRSQFGVKCFVWELFFCRR